MGQAPSSISGSNAPIGPPVLGTRDVTATTAQSCPVDQKSKEIWLGQAAKHDHIVKDSSPPLPHQPEQRSWLSFLWTSSSAPRQNPPFQSLPKATSSRLKTDREVSSIPRAYSDGTAPDLPAAASNSTSHASAPVTLSPNGQTLDPPTSPSGNWIYPSEEMFFNAMRRKSHNPRVADMSSVIPIHNAVNEQTWKRILAWEKGAASMASLICGGPKLVSFNGDSQKLTPRARWNALLGYEKPFDRHDWIVDRCGQRIEYVIDFYTGKKKEGDSMAPSFYLDVRPKLNSWEGFKMRVLRAIGWNK